MDYREIYESWLNNPYFDEDTKEELRAIADDENEIKERFIRSWSSERPGFGGLLERGLTG